MCLCSVPERSTSLSHGLHSAPGEAMIAREMMARQACSDGSWKMSKPRGSLTLAPPKTTGSERLADGCADTTNPDALVHTG